MVVVKIEMWPRGDESKKYPLAEMHIANVGGNASSGDYEFVAYGKGGQRWPGQRGTGRIERFPRKRLMAFDLLFRCLKIMVGPRNER